MPARALLFSLALAACACAGPPASPLPSVPSGATVTASAVTAAASVPSAPLPPAAPPSGDEAPLPRLIGGVDDAVQVGIGNNHACARRRRGDVVCWGSNDLGQLGAGGLGPRVGAGPVTGLPDAVHLSVDWDHACAVRAGGQVVCWGGRVPGTTTDNTTPPETMAGIAGAVAVATESIHTCALLRNGQVACLGENEFGALGHPPKSDDKSPAMVRGLAGATGIAVSHFGGCAARSDGTVMCWGSGAITAWVPGGPALRPGESDKLVTPALLPGVTDAVAVGTWDLQACVLRKNGSVRCWNTESRSMIPFEPLLSTKEPVGAEDVQSIQDDLCVLRGGRLAIPTAAQGPDGRLAKPLLPELTGVIAAAGSDFRGCAVLETGQVACWGGAETGGT